MGFRGSSLGLGPSPNFAWSGPRPLDAAPKKHLGRLVSSPQADNFEKRAEWKEEESKWVLAPPPVEAWASKRPLSTPGLRRPETEYARHRKQHGRRRPKSLTRRDGARLG